MTSSNSFPQHLLDLTKQQSASAEVKAKELKAKADEAARLQKVWENLDSFLNRGLPLHVLDLLDKEKALRDKMSFDNHPGISSLDEIYQVAKEQAGELMSYRFPAYLEKACSAVSLPLDPDSRHPVYKFDRGFFQLDIDIATPSFYKEDYVEDATPFGLVAQESLAYLATGNRSVNYEFSYEYYEKARASLMADRRIDIDFRKMIEAYWKTFLPETSDPTIQEQNRAEILAWFSGEGKKAEYHKRFGINKMVSRDTAKIMMESLAGFVKLSGYKGLVILLDEAEQSYSTMRKTSLKDAHNTLLSLINNIEALSGLFLIYATTPDFFNDPKHGIVINGALKRRIGDPEQRPPRAKSRVWNLDAVVTELSDYQMAAKKIRNIYAAAYPDGDSELPSEKEVELFVRKIFSEYSPYSPYRFWHILVSSLVMYFDDYIEGEKIQPEKIFKNVVDRFREE